MPDESRTIAARIAAWWRRGYDAELLALAPDVDDQGEPLVWDFPHPVNRSRGWMLLRPWILYPAIFGVLVMAIPLYVYDAPRPLSFWLSRLALVTLVGAVLGTVIFRRRRRRVERLALKAYHRWRWRGTAALDAAIADARARER